ncbi:MAG: hypothetical protein ACYDCG_03675 [Candidatus Acidiferrales bacterium]
MNETTKNNLLYIGIALPIAAIILGPLIYAISHDRDIPEFPLKPAWLIISTVVIIAYMVQDLRRRRVRMRPILPSLFCVAFVHVVINAAILRAFNRVPLLLLGVGVFVEAYVALQFLDKFVIRPGKANAHRT